MRLSALTALFLFFLTSQLCHADIYLVVNKNSPAGELSKKQVIDIYLGKNRSFDNGKYIQTIDHGKSSQIREDFYKKLTGKSLSFVNAYWARLFYTGRKKPPSDHYENTQEILDELSTNAHAMAYIDAVDYSPEYRIIYTIKR